MPAPWARSASPTPRPPATSEPGGKGSKLTWGAVLKLLLLVVVDHNVRLHRDQLFLVKLTQVEQSQLIKLLVAEENLCGARRRRQVGKPPPGMERGSWAFWMK